MRKRLPDFAAIVIALLHGAMALSAALHESATFDEPAHFDAGYSYSLRNDYRLDPESGNLPQRWAALPLLLEKPHFIAGDSHEWLNAESGACGVAFLYELGNNASHLLFIGRMMMTLVSIGVCLLVYHWSKRLWGVVGGLISISIAAFSPTLLAHGPLITSDVSITFFLAAAVWSYSALLERPSIARFLVCGASLAGVFVAKMSGPLVLPMMALLLLFYCARSVRLRERRILLLVCTTAALALPVIAGIWATYGFRYSALAVEDSYRSELNQRWARLLDDRGMAAAAISFARQHKLLPEAYLYGVNVVRRDSDERQAFLDGRWSFIGFADFFPRAFLYKTPIPLLLLLLLALGAAVWRLRESGSVVDWQRAAPLLALMVVYGAFAVGTGLNIGERHLLPIYPALFIACGGVATLLRARQLQTPIVAAVVMLVGWHVGESLNVRPHYLGYFSEFAGGPRHGWRHLVDSSLDWGQDLPGLKRWLDHHERDSARPVYLGYFGAALPESYGINATALPEPGDAPRRLRPGLYCLSATALQQVYSRAMGPWCSRYEMVYQQLGAELRARDARADVHPPEYWHDRVELYHALRFARLCATLRHREPIAQVGYSILIYDLNDDDLRQATAGPPAELYAGPQVAGR